MYDPSIGRWLEEDPEGFEAGDSNLYRYVKNSPTNATDPSGYAEDDLLPIHNVHEGPGTWSFWEGAARRELDISGSHDASKVRRAIQLLDSGFALNGIPAIDPTSRTPTAQFVAVTPDRARLLIGQNFARHVQLATTTEIARINIRVNLLPIKRELVDQIYQMLERNPPRVRVPNTGGEGRNPDTRETTAQDWAAAANGIADAYIRAVDDFLRTHPGAIPHLGQRSMVLDAIGVENETNAPWCADWASGINAALRADPNTNGTGTGLGSVAHYQIRFRSRVEHNIVVLSPAGREPRLYPTYDSGILILDPWRDLMPRAYIPGALSRTHVPTNRMQQARDGENEPEAPR